MQYVAGYAIGLDITIRGTEDRSFRKSADTYSVLGPWLVTADEIPDPGVLDLTISVNGETRQQEIVEVDIAAARRGDVAANLKLRAYDRLNVKRLEDWGSDETVELRGEVRFPGVYPIKRSDTL